MRGVAGIERAVRRARGRLARPAAVLEPAQSLAGSLLPPCLAGGRPDPRALRSAFRFFHGEVEMRELARRPEADRGLTEIARAIEAGSLPYFDHRLDLELTRIDWLEMPGRRRCRAQPSASYDHGDFVRWGDIRQLWELGRLQAAPSLLAASRIAGREAWTALAFGHLADFRRANPPGWGPHWISGLEGALRVFSLLWSWALSEDLDDERTLLLAASLLENGRFVESHLSLKEIANNHLVGESAALFILGCALPVFTDSARWRERGLALLDRERVAQVLPDGVLGEQAVDYHRFVLEFYLQALLWGGAAGEDLGTRWEQPLAAMFRPLRALTGPDGFLVGLGDDDGGRILRLDDRSRRDARGLLAFGSRCLGLEAMGPLAGRAEGEALWLLGPSRNRLTLAPEGLPAWERFDEAGWYVSRFGPEAATSGLPSTHLLFKAGPMGRGNAGHSHADQLSLTLSLDGQPVLVDSGTYLYNGPQEWRDYFRGAGAHSLLRVGGSDPAEAVPPPDRFGWTRKAEAAADCVIAGRRCRYLQALRRGDRDPEGLPLGVRRRLLQIPPGLILVLDEITAQETPLKELRVDLIWQCAPGIDARWDPAPENAIESPQDRGGSGLSHVPRMSFHALRLQRQEKSVLVAHCFAPGGLVPNVKRGESLPPAGWVSDDYAVKTPAAQAGLAGRGAAPLLIASLLSDPSCDPRLDKSILSRSSGGDYRLDLFTEPGEHFRVSFFPAGQEAGKIEDWVEDLQIAAPWAVAFLGPREELRALAALSPRHVRYRGQDLLGDCGSEALFEKEW